MEATLSPQQHIESAPPTCKFIYKDHFRNDHIVFECEAPDILVADELYRKETGLDPLCQAHVGCCMIKLDQQTQ